MRVSEVMLGPFLAWTAPVVGLQEVEREKRLKLPFIWAELAQLGAKDVS